MTEKFRLSIEGMEDKEESITRAVSDTFKEIRGAAKEQGKEIDRSALVALTNYSRYVGVSSLSDKDLHKVLLTIGSKAVTGAIRKVTSKDIAKVLGGYECNDAFGCSEAASKILHKRIDIQLEGTEEELGNGEEL